MKRPTLRIVLVALGLVFGVTACMQEADPNEVADLSRVAEGPQRYGDDERLDAMQDDCESGELLACDLLWLSSPEGSEYDRVAVTCGGTTEDTGEFCTPYPELDDDGYAPDDSEGLRQLAEQCKDGDMTACDVLFLIAPEGHELEELGYTCGGRADGDVEVDCRSELG